MEQTSKPITTHTEQLSGLKDQHKLEICSVSYRTDTIKNLFTF